MDGVLASVRSGKSKLVVLAEDASENTKKQLTDKCRYYGVQVILFGTKESLSNSIGAAGLVSALSVTDRNLAGAILQSIL